jgi:hypothetical protein
MNIRILLGIPSISAIQKAQGVVRGVGEVAVLINQPHEVSQMSEVPQTMPSGNHHESLSLGLDCANAVMTSSRHVDIGKCVGIFTQVYAEPCAQNG